MNNPALLETPANKTAINWAANKYCIDEHDFQDIAQECRIFIFEKMTDEEALKPSYVRRSCWSRAHRHHRDAERKADYINYLFATAEAEEQEKNYDEILSDVLGEMYPAQSIEQEIQNREELATIRAIAAHLSPKQERIFWLRYEGLSAKKIGKKLGLNPSTVEYYIEQIEGLFLRSPLAAQLFTEA